MKTIAVIVLLAVVSVSGYLFYDWHTVEKERQAAPPITLYYWQDQHGVLHVSETPPPKGAKTLKKTDGHAFAKQPLALRIKAAIQGAYRRMTARFGNSQ